MILVMVKEVDLNRIDLPEDYEVLDATARYNRKLWIRDSLRNVVYLPGK
jgi:hypothetical protein